MASTEVGLADLPSDGESPSIAALTTADLPRLLALSASAHWNQNEADWRMMLALGRGWGIRAAGCDGSGTLAASTVVLPYGTDFAWVSMVLVLPAFRRRGHASRLLHYALDALAAEGRSAVLDATPAGHAVYVQEGFADTWGFARWRREARTDMRNDTSADTAATGSADAGRGDGPPSRPLTEADWPAIAALDAHAFGADRLPLLRALAQRLPPAARVVEQGGRLQGFVLGRDGREAQQIGPLLAGDEATARALLADALQAVPGAVYVDLLDGRDGLCRWLPQQGFVVQRPFTRMVHGRKEAPGEPGAIMLVAGPELG
jgi:GNAT superfamily N-acetyltransferase